MKIVRTNHYHLKTTPVPVIQRMSFIDPILNKTTALLTIEITRCIAYTISYTIDDVTYYYCKI